MFKTYEYLDKFLYSPIEDENQSVGGGINIEENYNILGDDITSEASDVVLGAADLCCSRELSCADDIPEPCFNNTGCKGVIADISCRDNSLCVTWTTCPNDRVVTQSGVILTYIGVQLWGYQSGNTSNLYDINWLSAYSGDWKAVKLGVKSGTTYNKFTSASTKINLTQSGNTNYWYTYYTTNVSDITAVERLGGLSGYVRNVGYSVPGHHTGSCTLIQRATTGLTLDYALSQFNLRHSAQTLSAMCNVIQIENGTNYVGDYNTTKFGGVKYTFYNETQGVVVTAMTNTVYTNNSGQGTVAPQFIVHCPYQSFYVERSRPGLVFPSKEKITLTRLNGITTLYFNQFLSNSISRDYKVATLSDFKKMYPSASYTSLINSTDNNICLAGSLSKVTSVYPFGCFMSGDCYSQKVWLASDFLGMSGTTYGTALIGSSFNANTFLTSKKTVSLIPY